MVRNGKIEEKKEVNKDEAAKKAPFVDRVLQKALERVKGQIDKPTAGRDA